MPSDSVSASDPARTPVLVGLGQSIERDAVVDAVELSARAAEAAFADAPGLADAIDRVSMVAVSFSKVGLAPASEVAARLGLEDVACETTTPGGNTPQWLMNRACQQITAGELDTTLIVGAEATRSMKLSDPDSDFLTAGMRDRSGEEGPQDPVVGASVRGMLEQAEIEAGLLRPADVYPVFESVRARHDGHGPAERRAHIAAFMSRASEVAAKHPFAWFQQVRSADEIAEPSPANRITAEPYTKRMNSFANVDQGSALLVTTLARARAAGLADQCVFPWAGASNADVAPAARPELGGSPAIRAAARAVFAVAGVGLDDVDCFDLYSCFPVAVEVGAAEIGLALDDPRGLTLTGLMSFFGGPGNNYTSHGIIAAATRLRESGRLAYVSGNGGLLSKHSIGLYGRAPREGGFVLADTAEAQRAIEAAALEVTLEAEGRAIVEGGTVVYDRAGGVAAAPVIATLEDGRRVAAVADEALRPQLAGRSLAGESIRISGAHPPHYSL